MSGSLCFIFAPTIVSWFRDDPDVIEIGKTALKYHSLALPMMGIIIPTNMMLQSTGKGFKASITASARNGIFFIPLILILPRFFGLFGVQITQAAADVLSVFLCIPLAYSEISLLKDCIIK